MDPTKSQRRSKFGPTRRDLLRAIVAAPILAAIPSCGSRTPEQRTVIIVGGGLCGLRLLDLLVARGFDATLIEAGNRIGGRVLTLRDGISPGLRFEAGAERVPNEDARLRRLLGELGIKTQPYSGMTRPVTFEWEGRFYRLRDPVELPPAVMEGCSAPERQVWPTQTHLIVADHAQSPATTDARPAIAWLRDAGLTPRGEKFVRTWSGLAVDEIPAAALPEMTRREFAASTCDLIEGGSDRLTSELARRHASRIRQSVKIVTVGQDAASARVTDTTGRTWTADAVAICVALRPLRDLKFDAGTPKELSERIDGLGIGAEVKAALEVPADAFRDDGLTEYSVRDHFPKVTWRLPELSSTRTFLLNTMAMGVDAPALTRAIHGGTTAILAAFAGRIPELAQRQLQAVGHDFLSDPLFGGAYTYPKTLAAMATGPVSLGRVHISGADLSVRPGWMEGALAAAEATAAAIAP